MELNSKIITHKTEVTAVERAKLYHVVYGCRKFCNRNRKLYRHYKYVDRFKSQLRKFHPIKYEELDYHFTAPKIVSPILSFWL